MRTAIQTSTFLVVAAGLGLLGCSNGPDGSRDAELGSLDIALTVSGLTVSQVEMTITSEDLDPLVVRQRTVDVTDPNSSVSATEQGLPEGAYTVALDATVVDDPSTPDVDESAIPCVGVEEGVEVNAGETTNVDDFVLLCTVDGGQVQAAGGIRIEAQAEVAVINDCPDLIDAAFVGALDTSVGASVQLSAEHADDVTVAWSASAGTVSADGTSFTCPDVAGTYTLEAVFTRDADCEQAFTEQISCHNDYAGPVTALPEGFALVGDCSFGGPCHLEQEGKSWELVCGSRPDRLTVLSGEAEDEDSFPFIGPDGEACVAGVVAGELVGSCIDASGDACVFSSDSDPAPTPLCPVVAELTDVSTCSGSYDSCTVVQDGCDLLAKCGETFMGRNVNADGSVRIEEYYDSMTLRCEGPVDDGTATGTCSQVGRGVSDPVTCDYSAGIVEAESACEETLPAGGLVLEGCGFDDLCFARQQGCAWEVTCNSGVYGGIATGTDQFEFVGPGGEQCLAGVVGGEVVGTCGSEESECSFGSVEPLVNSSCRALPETLTARGCGFGSPTPFEVLQHDCRFLGYAPSRAVLVMGDVTETGIYFPGISPGWECSAEASDGDADELWGECTRENDDGSVSACRDLGQDAPLVIAL